jgi:hypothetical protein
MVMLCGLIMLPFLGAGHSPHTLLHPSDSNVRLADVVGPPPPSAEAVDTLNLFLSHQQFADELGGSPRRAASCSRAPPAPARPTWRRPWRPRRRALLVRLASSFQSMYYGQTNRKIRTFFKQLRKAARRRAGPSGSSRSSTPSAALAAA